MGAATRTALETVRAALDAEQKVTPAVGEQLLAAVRAIASSSQLRGLLADTSVSEVDKNTIISRVFTSLDPLAEQLLRVASLQRWSGQNEFVDGLEELGIRAVVRAAGSAAIDAELFAFGAAVRSDAELELALGSKLGDAARKAGLVERLLGGKASPATLTIVRHLVASARGRRIRELLQFAAETVASARERTVATVTVTAPLSAAQERRLAAALTSRFGTEPLIDVIVDPSIIGGMTVRVGDVSLDGSVAARLDELRLRLAS